MSRFIVGTTQEKRAKIDLRFNPVQVGQASLVLKVSVFLLVKQYWRCPIKVSSLAIPQSTGSLVTWLSLPQVFALVFPSTPQSEPHGLAHCIPFTCQACSLLYLLFPLSGIPVWISGIWPTFPHPLRLNLSPLLKRLYRFPQMECGLCSVYSPSPPPFFQKGLEAALNVCHLLHPSCSSTVLLYPLAHSS